MALLTTAPAAHAELVFFASGRSLSVKGHRVENGSLALSLRGGGEILCDPAIISRIEPDEVPYPEPPPVAVVETIGPGPEEGRAAGETPSLTPAQYASLIDRAAATHGVDPKLVRAVIQVESAYQHRARSPKGAMGLMQLMPATARQYSVRNPYDPAANIDAGIRHLKSLLQRFPLRLAIAAYNAGPGAVERFRGIPPYPETRMYVSRVLKLFQSA
jgi:hypothetical protein